MAQYLALDLGGTFTKYALMREDGVFLEKGQIPSACDSIEHMLEGIAGVGEKYRGQYEGAAVSIPGRIDTQNGIAHTGGAFTFLKDTPVAQLLEERLKVPATIANDGKCAANAELWKGALQGVQSGVVIVLGTGTGGGIILDGKVWMGHTFGAGELSWLITDFAAFSHGTGTDANPLYFLWAGYLSVTGLLLHYRAHKGIAPEVPLDGFAFFSAYDAGEREAVEALHEFGRSATAGIFTIQSILDVERIAIGGGISARPEVTETIRQAVEQRFAEVPKAQPFLPPPFGKPEIVPCRFGNDANLIGALSFHLQRISSGRSSETNAAF